MKIQLNKPAKAAAVLFYNDKEIKFEGSCPCGGKLFVTMPRLSKDKYK